MRKKVWVSAGDIVLVSMREFQDGKGDVILKYAADEARELKTLGQLPDSVVINDTADGEEEEGGVEFVEDDDDEGGEVGACRGARERGGARERNARAARKKRCDCAALCSPSPLSPCLLFCAPRCRHDLKLHCTGTLEGVAGGGGTTIGACARAARARAFAARGLAGGARAHTHTRARGRERARCGAREQVAGGR